MRRLIILRHAKSSWADSGLADADRPLNKRGLRDAPRMAVELATNMRLPDAVISSPAIRAITTARLVIEAWGGNSDAIISDPRVYLASAPTLKEIVANLHDDHASLMLVGHNPGLSDFAQTLTQEIAQDLVTCACAVIEWPVDDWASAMQSPGQLQQLLRPADLESEA